MSEPFIGEIRLFGGNFAPQGWAFCDGQLLSISQFSLVGTTYGGDGVTTFALPDLRGRVPVHQGQGQATSNRIIGEQAGSENVTLIGAQMAAHNHALSGTTSIGNESGPAGNVLAQSSVASGYINDTPDTSLAAASIATTGGSQPHENMGPYLAVSFIIALEGIFPSQN